MNSGFGFYLKEERETNLLLFKKNIYICMYVCMYICIYIYLFGFFLLVFLFVFLI